MHKSQAVKLEIATAGCVFDGVPLHKLQRLRALLTGNWRGRTRQSLLVRTTIATTRAA